MSEQAFRAHHDMGGEPGGPVDRDQHAHAFWEKRVDALMALLSSPKRRLLRVDELRRCIESLPPDAYDSMSYYERWISSITAVMLEKGIVTQAELDARIAALRARGAGR